MFNGIGVVLVFMLLIRIIQLVWNWLIGPSILHIDHYWTFLISMTILAAIYEVYLKLK